MPKQPSRAVAKKDDLDLTPPEEIRARRIRLLVFLGALAVCVLGVAIYFAAPPVGGAIKAWQSRRLARQAFALIEQGKWSEANAKARDAYLLRPTEAESWRAIARLASRTSQWAPALEWWKKVDDADRLTVEDRRDYIAAALVAGEVTLGSKTSASPDGTTRTVGHRSGVGRSSRQSSERSCCGTRLCSKRARRINAQNRMKFWPLLRSFSLSPVPIRSHTPARGNKLKMWRVTQRIPGRLARSFFWQTNRLCRPCPQSAATHRFRSRAPGTISNTWTQEAASAELRRPRRQASDAAVRRRLRPAPRLNQHLQHNLAIP